MLLWVGAKLLNPDGKGYSEAKESLTKIILGIFFMSAAYVIVEFIVKLLVKDNYQNPIFDLIF